MRLRPTLALAASVTVLALVAPSLARPQASSASPHGGLALDCTECHTAQAWTPLASPLTFRHETTGFRLEGAHAREACRGCHDSLVFSRVGAACADCHADPHRGELGFRCETCHVPYSWTNQRLILERHARSLFPLVGQHANVDCEGCHRGQQPQQYVLAPLDCGGCHARSYEAARSPDHVRAGFGRRCEECHLPLATRWSQVSYQHPATYPLLGAHAGASCEGCHTGTFAGTTRECVACHRADYDGTRDPDHRAGGFPTTCDSCHTVTAWRPASFVDHSQTRFPLTGAHQGLDCAACHVNGRFAGTPTECVACHRSDYDGTRDPNHVAAGFPTTCESCHTTNAWQPASNVDHDQTGFPLTGAHRDLDCNECHASGFAGTPRDCVACHRDDYDGTRDPNHAAAGFPTTCDTCHTTTRWEGATFDHDSYFPIDSGAHRGQWSGCDTCHTNPSNYRVFECTGCHEHSRSEMDDKHHEVPGYSYDSQACYRCHPRGRED